MFKRVWYKIYYGIVIFFLVREHRKQWDKCLELQGTRQIGRLATEFRKSEEIRKQIQSEREKIK
jgi:hypothetical protein